MKPDNKAGGPWLYALGLVPVIWFALLIAPAISGGLSEIVSALPAAMNNPFKIVWCEDSVKTVLIFIAAYGLGIGIYLSSRRNYRRGEEHGSAKWGDPRAVNKKYRDKDPFKNRIFTQHVRMGLDGRKHRRNLNTLVVGGSGAGKSRFYAKVNICQCNTSFFILDCKGELLRDCGGLLERMGYEIKVVDLLNMEKSHCYNPFAYLKSDNDVQKMVTNLFKATTPKGSQSNDPFWDTAASMLLMALVFYLWYEAPEDEKNFPMVMEMLRAGEVREDDDSYQSPLDELFDRLEMRSPDHIAVKYYKDYRSGSAKTLKSIQITLASRLEKFNLSSVAALTATDELDLSSLGEKKVALFALIPDNDSSFTFLISLLYASTFQELFYSADRVHGGSLPTPVHFLMDEFANVSLPDDFDKLLATMRSRNISVSTVANGSNVALSNFFWHDKLPYDITSASTLITGTYNQRLTYQVLYKTNYNGYRVLASNLLTTNTYSFSLNALPLMQGEVVTDVYFDFGTVPAGFQSMSKPMLIVSVSPQATNGYYVTNRADAGGQYLGTWETGNTAWVTIVRNLNSTPKPTLPQTGY